MRALRSFCLGLVCGLLASGACIPSSALGATTITADHLEHFAAEDKFIATGTVRIEKDGAVLLSDRAVLYNATSDAEASGNVVFEDSASRINAERAELNLDTKTGTLYNTIITLKNQDARIETPSGSEETRRRLGLQGSGREVIDFRILSGKLEKLSDDHFYAAEAAFTTCDPEPGSTEAWCFKGHDVDLKVGKRLTANNVTYRLKGLPALYTPWFWAPVGTERQTGFLFPLIGNSSQKGFHFNPAFFWAIDENKDATFALDYYSRRGIGTSAEYRYLGFTNAGTWYAYHIRDKELKKNFVELKAMHEQRFNAATAYADIDYVNEESFFREYALDRDRRLQSFLQSSVEVSLPLRRSRLYLLGQHWIDLQTENAPTLDRLPELGFVVHPTSAGPVTFYLASSVANFIKEDGARGQRFDINPVIFHAMGDSVRLFQSLSLRETAYRLSNADEFGSSPHRETFEYVAQVKSKLFKHYSAATHIIEPTLSYRFIPKSSRLPVFDSADLFDNVSQASLSLYNSLGFSSFSLAAQLTQSVNFNAGDRSLAPLAVSLSISGPVTVTFDMTHSFSTGRIETFNTDIRAPLFKKIALGAGQRYTRAGDVHQYYAAVDALLSKRWSAYGTAWYDSSIREFRDVRLTLRHTQQCWVADLIFERKPGTATQPAEYRFAFAFQLIGLGGLQVGI